MASPLVGKKAARTVVKMVVVMVLQMVAKKDNEMAVMMAGVRALQSVDHLVVMKDT
jgi:hypothetical protein